MSSCTTRASGSRGQALSHDPNLAIDRCALVRQVFSLGLVFCTLCCATRAQTTGSKVAAETPDRPLAKPQATANSPARSAEADSASARAETLERLKEFEPLIPGDATAPGGTAGSATRTPAAGTTFRNNGAPAAPGAGLAGTTPDKAIPALLQERLHWLDEYDATTAALRKVMHPEPSPEQRIAEAKTELSKWTTVLNQANSAPETLLPSPFRDHSVANPAALGSDMKDAIEAANNELKDWRTKLEFLRGEMAKWNTLISARRTERDNLFEHVTSLAAKTEEFKSAVTDAQNAADRRLAHERLINFEWHLRVQTLRLQLLETQIALENRLTELREQQAEIYRAHIQITSKKLEPMQARYRRIIEDQQRDLAVARNNAENKARSADDPLERFRAWRTAEMLALKALVIRNEQDLVVSPAPSYEEQKTLADHADYDFANIRELLDDGKVSRLDAVRLNNEFRRIGPERDGVTKTEKAVVEAQLQFYENALSSVELELLQDSLHGRFEHDLLRERLPAELWTDAETIVRDLEKERRILLLRRQRALEKLCARASHTLVQVSRRLNILDREYNFIRTNIFWVRDQEPIGLATLTKGVREFDGLVKGLLRLARETVSKKLWGQPSGEFLAAVLGVIVLPFGIVRLRRVLAALNLNGLRKLAAGGLRVFLWPLYLVVVAYAARTGPWPHSLGVLVSAVSTGAAIAILIHDLLHRMSSPGGRPEHFLEIPPGVARQLNRSVRFVVIAAALLLVPVYLLDHELIMPEGKPVSAPALARLMVLIFELVVWGTCMRLLHRYSPFLGWLSVPAAPATEPESPGTVASTQAEGILAQASDRAVVPASSWARAVLLWLGRRRRIIAMFVLATIAGIIALDMRGYSFTARRLALGVSQTGAAIALALVVNRAIAVSISRNAWRWAQPNRSWAMALTSAMALRATVRVRGAAAGEPPSADEHLQKHDDDSALDDIACGLRRLGSYFVAVLAVVAVAWIWEVDMALVQFLLDQPLGQTSVTVANVAVAAAVMGLGALAWRYMSTLFAVTIFKRMPDDPGVRFAVVTLCRYTVLGLTTLVALGAIHIDLAKISVILAALGVGLGFGLQEVVSNFVCGIILLLERPIRIGDVVTVAGSTGTVDRINIRATTIINSDNQSMIVPNREFITGNLVNWTLKDKITRVPIKLTAAYGTDPDRVVNLLRAVARADADVMIKPGPSASLEGFGESSLMFGLSAYVPDPGLAGDVKHRLCAEIQRRFKAEGIVIPYPTHELHVNNRDSGEPEPERTTAPGDGFTGQPYRYDPASKSPPPPHAATTGPQAADTSDEKMMSRQNESR